jgi:hypothetical protein
MGYSAIDPIKVIPEKTHESSDTQEIWTPEVLQDQRGGKIYSQE